MKKKERLDNGALSDALGLPGGQLPVVPNQSPVVSTMGLYPNMSASLLSLQPYLLNLAYKTYGFIQSAIDVPVADAFRGGIKIETSTLDSDEIDLLYNTMQDHGDFKVAQQSLIWKSLFGGGVVIANTEQNSQRPLSKRLQNKNLEFVAADRWEACCEDGLTPEDSNFIYHGLIVDKTRVFPVIGKEAPYYIRMQLQGWGISELDQMLPPLVQYLKSQNVMLELLDEAKIDILKIKGLAQTLATPDGVTKVKQRVDTAASNKNYKSMLTMDADDAYEQKQLTLSGIPEFNKEIRLGICAALGMPEVKIWGTGEGGFSNGEDKLEIYNSTKVESGVRYPAEPLLKWMINLRALQLFGRELPDLKIEWSNLRSMPEDVEQNVRTAKLDDILKLSDRGLITPRGVWELIQQMELLPDIEDNNKNLSNEIEEFADTYAKYEITE